MNLFCRSLLALCPMTLPAALWLGGEWWKWLATAAALFFAASVAAKDGKTPAEAPSTLCGF